MRGSFSAVVVSAGASADATNPAISCCGRIEHFKGAVPFHPEGAQCRVHGTATRGLERTDGRVLAAHLVGIGRQLRGSKNTRTGGGGEEVEQKEKQARGPVANPAIAHSVASREPTSELHASLLKSMKTL